MLVYVCILFPDRSSGGAQWRAARQSFWKGVVMYGRIAKRNSPQGGEPWLSGMEKHDPSDDWDEWCELEPSVVWDDFWDAFASDDEMAEPEPEYGDFWGELDTEEPI